jgi:hypothetical protein
MTLSAAAPLILPAETFVGQWCVLQVGPADYSPSRVQPVRPRVGMSVARAAVNLPQDPAAPLKPPAETFNEKMCFGIGTVRIPYLGR